MDDLLRRLHIRQRNSLSRKHPPLVAPQRPTWQLRMLSDRQPPVVEPTRHLCSADENEMLAPGTCATAPSLNQPSWSRSLQASRCTTGRDALQRTRHLPCLACHLRPHCAPSGPASGRPQARARPAGLLQEGPAVGPNRWCRLVCGRPPKARRRSPFLPLGHWQSCRGGTARPVHRHDPPPAAGVAGWRRHPAQPSLSLVLQAGITVGLAAFAPCGCSNSGGAVVRPPASCAHPSHPPWTRVWLVPCHPL